MSFFLLLKAEEKKEEQPQSVGGRIKFGQDMYGSCGLSVWHLPEKTTIFPIPRIYMSLHRIRYTELLISSQEMESKTILKIVGMVFAGFLAILFLWPFLPLILAGVAVWRYYTKKQRNEERRAAKPEEYRMPSLPSRWVGKKPGFTVPKTAVVTGGSGFVGQRLVEMLQERGCQLIVSFDLAPKPVDAREHPAIRYVRGDLTDLSAVMAAFKIATDVATGMDCCVFHIAALVGPFHPEFLYEKVNVGGTKHVLAAVRELGIGKIVMSSSPSTRMDFSDCSGLSEADFRRKNKGEYSRHFTHAYARTKAEGEQICREANDGKTLLTVAVAPHQVYGPGDQLFFPHLLKVASTGKLRTFGDGQNWISVTYNDNYCHGLLCAYGALYPGSPALAQYYVVTDGAPVKMWDWINRMICELGLPSLTKKFALPEDLMELVGYTAYNAALLTATLTGKPRHLLIKQFTLSPFTVKMMLIERWFRIEAAVEDLGYQPIFSAEHAFKHTRDWFMTHWVPTKEIVIPAVPRQAPGPLLH
eukprot:g12494.t1